MFLDIKTTKNRGKIRTMKIIEEERQKTEFFSELAEEIQLQFPKEHIDFLLYFGGSHKNSKSRWLIGQTNYHLRTPSAVPTERVMMDLPGQSSPVSKVDLNVFNTLYKSKEAALRLSKEKEHKKENNQPANEQNLRFTKQRLPRHLFEIDKKMKKNYERVKQRMKFYTPQSTFRRSEEKCEWNMLTRSIATKRKKRYNTECQEDKLPSGDGIPTMLLGELANRRSLCVNMENLGKDDRRWECFGGESGRLRRRYKYGQ